MKRGFLHYYLMISCPSDVEEEARIIKDTIEEVNTDIGEQLGINLKCLHWKRNSRPDSGDTAQNIINEQLLNQADGIIALFWTRFGTPTSKYGSGTEEEITKAIEQGKSVKLYFSDRPISPSVIEGKQYNNVIAFREKYLGLSMSFKSSEEFQKMLRSHLSQLLYDLRDKETESSQNDGNIKRRDQTHDNFRAILLKVYNESCEYRTSFRLGDEARINNSTVSLTEHLQELYYFQESTSLAAPEYSMKAAAIIYAYNQYAHDFNMFNDALKANAENRDSLAQVAQDAFSNFVQLVLEALNQQ